MKNTEAAFHWIIGILKKHNVSFRISGGLAAKIYGCQRPLADIDIDIPEKRFKDILPDVKDRIIIEPKKYFGKIWDIFLVTLRYEGQDIDVCAADTAKIYNSKTGEWINYSDGLNAEEREIYGMSVPVIPLKDLIEYKTKLGRQVDVEDIKAVQNYGK